MTTGNDLGGVLSAASLDPAGPAIQPCLKCGQALPGHLPMCPSLLPSSAIPEQTVEAVNQVEKDLGEAV